MSEGGDPAAAAKKKTKKEPKPKPYPVSCQRCNKGRVRAKVTCEDLFFWLCKPCTLYVEQKGASSLDAMVDQRRRQPPLKTEMEEKIQQLYEQVIGKRIYEDITDLRLHIDQLDVMRGTENSAQWNGFDIEFHFLEARTARLHMENNYNYASALMDANRSKNRYANVLPPENSRVVLTQIGQDEHSDYVNANFCDGLLETSRSRYIAAQGPLEETFADFWRMCWETNVSVIVMLTREIEAGRVKCAVYWPEGTAVQTFGSVTLALEDKSEHESLITRKFKISVAGSPARVLTHYQYTEWPDNGLPKSTATFLEMIHKVDLVNPTKGPIVVHCSAGIGRTGTFCTVHAHLEKFVADVMKGADSSAHTFNILKTVLQFRGQRPGIIQTKEQLTFCYVAILEGTCNYLKHRDIMFRPTEAPPLDTSHYQSLPGPPGRSDEEEGLRLPVSTATGVTTPVSATPIGDDSMDTSDEGDGDESAEAGAAPTDDGRSSRSNGGAPKRKSSSGSQGGGTKKDQKK